MTTTKHEYMHALTSQKTYSPPNPFFYKLCQYIALLKEITPVSYDTIIHKHTYIFQLNFFEFLIF